MTDKEIEELIFIYENCNILNADAIRERLKPIINSLYVEFLNTPGAIKGVIPTPGIRKAIRKALKQLESEDK